MLSARGKVEYQERWMHITVNKNFYDTFNFLEQYFQIKSLIERF